jgi:hypothetical protein
MIRDVSREEVRNVAGPLWLLINQSSWPANPGKFDVTRNGAASIAAHLAYCAIGADERERKNRAKVIPCGVYQKLVAGAEFDFLEALRSMDFADVEVVSTKFFVAIVIPLRQFLVIGVRGTQFGYDWAINAKVIKAKDDSGAYFHSGFLREAQELAAALRTRLQDRFAQTMARSGCAIYLAGHSLGGAVAAILNQMQFPVPINECYMFGAPRVSNASRFSSLNQPYATRRYLDVVPHCPPSSFNYVDFGDQKATDGSRYEPASRIEMYFFSSWLVGMAVSQFPENHSMEHYRFEVMEQAKKANQQYWRSEWPDFKPPTSR